MRDPSCHLPLNGADPQEELIPDGYASEHTKLSAALARAAASQVDSKAPAHTAGPN